MNKKGFTLIEVIVSIVLVSLEIISFFFLCIFDIINLDNKKEYL